MVEQENATAYEKAVFESVSYLISPSRDDDEAFQLHLKVTYMYFDLSILFKLQFLLSCWIAEIIMLENLMIYFYSHAYEFSFMSWKWFSGILIFVKFFFFFPLSLAMFLWITVYNLKLLAGETWVLRSTPRFQLLSLECWTAVCSPSMFYWPWDWISFGRNEL